MAAATLHWEISCYNMNAFCLELASQLKAFGRMTLDSCLGSFNGEYRSAFQAFELQHNWFLPYREVLQREKALKHQVRSVDQNSSAVQECFECVVWVVPHNSTNSIDGATDELPQRQWALLSVWTRTQNFVFLLQTCHGCILLDERRCQFVSILRIQPAAAQSLVS